MTTKGPQNDNRLIAWLDPLVALALLTRIPIRVPAHAFNRSAAAAWAYPLVGIVTALIGYAAATAVSVDPIIAAILATAAMTVVTGAMHEDGLADSADGLWGAWQPPRRLEIMKDSQIGTYGVLALILSYALRITTLSVLIPTGALLPALVAAHALSRAMLPAVMYALPNARNSGLSHRTGRVSLGTAEVGLILGALITLISLGFDSVMIFVAAGAATLACSAIALEKIKGQTGDILGATQQITEISILIACLVVLA